MRFTKIRSVLCCGGCGRDVVVVIIEVVAVDVGSREPDCDVVRSIIEVVIGGTEEKSFSRFCREDRVLVELAGSSRIIRSSDGSLRANSVSKEGDSACPEASVGIGVRL
nr:hypothetical protein [Tanacetum cinerariifolium]